MATVSRSCRGRTGPLRTSRRRRSRGGGRPGSLAEGLEGRVLLATYTVTTPADAGPGSLRQAILDANANPGLDTIRGSVPRSEAVRPLSALPAITDRVSFVSVGLLIVDGSAAGPGSDGLVFEAGAAGSRADRVTVQGFGGSGFRIHAADTTLAGCSVLDNGRGAAPAPGVAVEGGSVVVMGGPVTDPHPTFISGSGGDGLAVTGGGSATLQRAWIGIGSFGALHLTGNAGHGVSVSDGGALNVESDATYPVEIGGSGGDGIRINPGSRPGVFRYLRIGIAQVDLIRPNAARACASLTVPATASNVCKPTSTAAPA